MTFFEPAFPEELLSATDEARIRYFSEKRLAHPHLKAVFERVLSALEPSNPHSLVLVTGPTGVGKTTLCRRIVKHFQDLNSPPEPGRIAVAMIEATAPSSGGYDWKEHFVRALEAMGEPLVDRKAFFGGLLEQQQRRSYSLPRKNPSTMDLRTAFESCLANRKPKVFVIDEAQHLKKVASGKRLIDQMDTIKSISNRSDVKHLMVGTYDILDLSDLSGQLNRRTVEIHLPRYRYEIEEERESFQTVLANLVSNLPVPNQRPLDSHLEYIYQMSAGCVGILKDWMTEALALALSAKSTEVSIAHLESTSISDRQLDRIVREIREGEQAFDGNRRDSIRSNLGMSPIAIAESNLSKPTVGFKRLPGKRKPKRDPVGLQDPGAITGLVS
jgi:GTPase SAR1 family protein